MSDEQPREVTFEIVQSIAPPQPRLSHAVTLANLWQVYIGLRNLRPSSIERIEEVARKFCRFFESKEYGGLGHKLSPGGMVEWMQHLREHRSATKAQKPLAIYTINKINTFTRSFLKFLRQQKYLTDDLSECIPTLLDNEPKITRIFTEEEYEKIKAYCAGRSWTQPHLWLFILGYRTGMSLIDCCHLRWRDVHLNDDGPSYMDIYRIKMSSRMGDKSICKIPIVPFSDLHLWLLNLRNVKPWKRADGITDYVHQEGPGLYACSFQRLRTDFKNICIRAGVDPKKTFKCLRNSMCSNLVNSGMSLPSVCQITGHNSVKVLIGYLKPDRQVLQDGVAKAQQYSAGTVKDGKYSTGFQPGDAAFL